MGKMVYQASLSAQLNLTLRRFDPRLLKLSVLYVYIVPGFFSVMRLADFSTH
jgi:hypothetical protein